MHDKLSLSSFADMSTKNYYLAVVQISVSFFLLSETISDSAQRKLT